MLINISGKIKQCLIHFLEQGFIQSNRNRAGESILKVDTSVQGKNCAKLNK